MRKKPNRSGPTSSRNQPRLIVIVGSCYQILLDNLEIFDNCIMIAVDVPDELARLRFLNARNATIITFPLGKTKTIKDLIAEHGSPRQQKAIDQFSNLSSKDGLGQIRGIGQCAMRDLLQQPDVIERLSKLVPLLVEMSNGELNAVLGSLFSGLAGGVGSIGTVLLMDAIKDSLQKQTNLPIHFEVHLVGAVTFQGDGFCRTQQNSACALTDWAVRAGGDSRFTVTLFGYELPPVGHDRNARNQLLRAQQTAMTAEVVLARIQQERSNRGTKSEFGNIFLPRLTFFNEIAERQKQSDVAKTYILEIEELLDTEPSRGTISVIEFIQATSIVTRNNLDELLEDLVAAPDDAAINELLSSAVTGTDVHGSVVLTDGSDISLANLIEAFADATESPSQCGERLGMLLALLEHLADGIADREAELQQFEQLEADHKRRAIYRIRSLQGRNRIVLGSQNRLLSRAESAVEGFLDCATAYVDVLNELRVLQNAEATAARLVDELVERLERIHESLEECIRYGSGFAKQSCVVAKPLAETFWRLTEAIDNSGAAAPTMAEMLSRCAGPATLSGLAQIVGAADTSIEAIASAVVNAESGIRSPDWGVEPRHDLPTQFIVYPALEPGVRTRIIHHHSIRNDGHEIAFASVNAPSRNLAVIELRTCRDLKDLLTDFYLIALQQAVESPISALLVDDPSTLADLGIDVQCSTSNSSPDER